MGTAEYLTKIVEDSPLKGKGTARTLTPPPPAPRPRTVVASYNKLIANGWVRTTKPLVSRNTYPSSGRIVLERAGKCLEHSYILREDSSDYPGHEYRVMWYRVELVAVTLFDVRVLTKNKPTRKKFAT